MPIPALIYRDLAGEAPADYRLGPGEEIRLGAIEAAFDGGSVTEAWRPCVTILSQDGKVLSRTFTDDPAAAGDTARVTFIPF